MKKNKIGLILIAALLIACVALVATACNPDDNKPKTYTLSFVVEGETVAPIVSEPGLDITPPTAPEKENMRFLGWFLNNEGEAVALPTIMPAANRTYYARYESTSGGEEEIKIPEEYTLKLDEIDSDNHLYIDLDGVTVYIEYGGKVAKSELSADGNYVEFTLNRTDYCAVLDGTQYGVYEYGFSKDSYVLYLPMDDSFNTERTLVFVDESNFKIVGDYYGNDWALGTYSVINPSTQEFDLTVTENYTYGLFDSCKVKLTKRVRRSEETGAKTLVYNAFNIFEEELYGDFTSDDGEKLSLDGYGYATYTDKDGNTVVGVYGATEIASFGEDVFVTFLDTATNKSQLYCLLDGNSFMSVGNEIGFYLEYNVEDDVAGYYYLLLFGNGLTHVYYYNADNSNEETGAAKYLADASYEALENGEYKFTFDKLNDGVTEEQLEAPFNGTFNFKLTTYGSGYYATKAFSIFNPNLAGTWSAENGASTIVLDGYGNATHSDGSFSGVMEISTDLHLLLITDENDNQRIFRFDDSDSSAITFRRIGLEIGNYETYSYVTGFDKSVFIYFDGEGKVDYYVFDPAVSEGEFAIQSSGTYVSTDNEDEYEITLGDDPAFKIAIRQLNFGNLYYPDWHKIYVVYDATLAGVYTTVDGSSTLELDGYGFNGVYTEDNGKFRFSGEFAKEWSLVTLLAADDEGYDLFTFKILAGNKFELKENEAGVYYYHELNSDLTTDEIRLFLDGDGNAYYAVLDGESKNATYVYDAESEDYTLSFTGVTDTMKFNLSTRNGNPVFIEYDENWAGSYINEDNKELYLDGYGNVIYLNETTNVVTCTVFGKDYDTVTFRWYGYRTTFILDKENHTYETTDEHVGIYYPYDKGTISGYTRLILNVDDSAELQEFDTDLMKYVTKTKGEYDLSKKDNLFTFTDSESGLSFSFKLTEVGGYDVYRLHDEYAATLKGSVSLYNGTVVRETTLILDGYGGVTYTFYDVDDEVKQTVRKRVREGYYYVTDESPLYNLIYVATNEDGVEYAKYYINVDWDKNTFVIYYEE